jgi:hypothetical protein
VARKAGARTQVIYRDTRTGRFASKATWTRSKAKGGTRYKRGRVTVEAKPAGQIETLEEFEEEQDRDYDFEEEEIETSPDYAQEE